MPRNFAARLCCSRCGADSWLTLSNREESFEQVLQLTWDFKCREHGPQRGTPTELLEVAPLDEPKPVKSDQPSLPVPTWVSPAKKVPRSSTRLTLRVPIVVYGFGGKSGAFQEEAETILVNSGGALVVLKAKLSIGDTVFLIHKSSRHEQEVRVAYLDPYSDNETRVGLAFKQPIPDFWRRNRKKPRIPKTFRVVVKGTDSKGHAFSQTAYTVDLSQDGARLDGIGFLTSPGQTIEVHRLWRKASYRVVWVGQAGTAESNQVGAYALQSGKNIWRLELPGTLSSTASPSPRK